MHGPRDLFFHELILERPRGVERFVRGAALHLVGDHPSFEAAHDCFEGDETSRAAERSGGRREQHRDLTGPEVGTAWACGPVDRVFHGATHRRVVLGGGEHHDLRRGNGGMKRRNGIGQGFGFEILVHQRQIQRGIHPGFVSIRG